MGRRRQPGRNVNGILLLDKPIGWTSNTALQHVKGLFRARKAGHTGSLDPLAEGLLPICFGVATKLSAFLLDADKRYRVVVKLGVTTTTGDAEGEVLETASVEGVSEKDIRAAALRFTGNIEQIPPMYSAVKHKGERLYRLARQGIEVERKPRAVSIYAIELVAFESPSITIDVHCSKGTYVRTLAEDMGRVLGCGAHVSALRRTGVGPFGDEDLADIGALEQRLEESGPEGLDRYLLPPESALQDWPDVRLSDDAAYYLRMGQAVLVPKAPLEGWVRLYTSSADFIGVGHIDEDGKVAPKRLIQAD